MFEPFCDTLLTTYHCTGEFLQLYCSAGPKRRESIQRENRKPLLCHSKMFRLHQYVRVKLHQYAAADFFSQTARLVHNAAFTTCYLASVPN